ncbi:unnamed protein product, partial [Protopolystoma xenopodis]
MFTCQQRLSQASKIAASRRSRVLLSQAVAELGRATVSSALLDLALGLDAFNTSAEWAMRRLSADMSDTRRALEQSEWLAGARQLYETVRSMRNEKIDPSDATKPFVEWTGLLATPELLNSAINPPPKLTLSPHLPRFRPADLQLPVPPIRLSPGKHSPSASVSSSKPFSLEDLSLNR